MQERHFGNYLVQRRLNREQRDLGVDVLASGKTFGSFTDEEDIPIRSRAGTMDI